MCTKLKYVFSNLPTLAETKYVGLLKSVVESLTDCTEQQVTEEEPIELRYCSCSFMCEGDKDGVVMADEEYLTCRQFKF